MKHQLKSPYVIAAVALVAVAAGLWTGYVLTNTAENTVNHSADKTGVKAYILLDDSCDVCNKELNFIVSYLDAEFNFSSVPREYVHTGSKKGFEVYKKLLENNVNRVPVIVFEGNVFTTDFYRAFKEKLGEAQNYIINAGGYYVLLPAWTTRVYDPERPGRKITVHFDANVGRDNVERFFYRIVPDAELKLVEANGSYLLKVEADSNVISILKQIFPLSEVNGNVLKVPYVDVNVAAQKGFLQPVAASIGQVAPNVRVVSTEELDANSPYLAVISTNRPDLLGKVLEGWAQEGNKFVARKAEKPKVELFVMSYCPFGLQAEKAILPVLRLLGDKIDFKLRFVDYAMHGEEEVWENLRQHCIQLKTDLNTLLNYLQCFTEKGDAEQCMEELNIDKNSIQECIDAETEKYGIREALEDKTEWKGPYPPYPVDNALNMKYKIQGSPTLVIEGIVVPTPRNPEGLKDLICSAFIRPPEECKKTLSSKNASPGFGAGFEGDASAGQCG